MTVRWERFAGRTDRFAVRFTVMTDPDDGAGATPEESASWGSFQLWVEGRNLCSHLDQGELLSSVHWYLLPLAEWLISNWNPLLHEERLPVRNSADTGIGGLSNTELAPALAGEFETAHWEAEWYSWWGRHALPAARSGGLLPNVVLRRLRDYVEVSWNAGTEAGAPDGFTFLSSSGAALLEPEEVAGPLFDVVNALLGYLDGLGLESVRLLELAQNIEKLTRPEQADGRRAWLAGAINPVDGPEAAVVVSSGGELAGRWVEIVGALRTSGSIGAFNAALAVDSSQLVVTGSCQAALLFSSISPNISADDVRTLAAVLANQYVADQQGGKGLAEVPLTRIRLSRLSADVPIDAPGFPWEQGYELAETLHENLPLDLDSGWVDVEKVLHEIGVDIVEHSLNDVEIRACSLLGPQHRPTIIQNLSSRYSSANARRFTLAHELCHLLFDRGHGSRLAIASGPWAPRAVERRANAFAAMFLMPSRLIEELIADAPDPVVDLAAIVRLSRRLRVSRRAVIDHLYNLTIMGEADRDRLIAQLPA